MLLNVLVYNDWHCTIDNCRSQVMCSNKCAWCLECPSTRSQFAANGLVGDLVAKKGYSCTQRQTPRFFLGAFLPSWQQLLQCPWRGLPVLFWRGKSTPLPPDTGAKIEMDSVTLFDPGTRQVLPSNSVSTAQGDSSLLDLIWQSMQAAPVTFQSPGLTHWSSDKS